MKTFFKTIGIGALAGYCTLFLPAFLLWGNFSSKEYLLQGASISSGVAMLLGVPLGIIGALIGRYLKKTGRATWIGGFVGGLAGILAFVLFLVSGGACVLVGC